MTNITEIHRQCFEYLMDKNRTDPSFVFMIRQKVRNGRSIENGYIFYGNKSYLQISFWDSRNWIDKLYNIGFVIKEDGSSYIEITGRKETEKIKFLRALAGYLKKQVENQKLRFETKADKWRVHYKGNKYIDNLKRFIAIEKPLIDSFIKEYENAPIEFITQERFGELMRKAGLKPNNAVM